MICPKCSTYVFEEDNFCKNCGKRLIGYKKNKMTAGILAVLMAVTGCCIYIYISIGNAPSLSAPAGQSAVTHREADLSVTPEPNATLATPVTDLSRNLNDVWADLTESYEAAKQYITDYPYMTFVSKNGYLYDMYTKAPVTPFDLTETSKLNPRFAEEKIIFLYVKPTDFANFDEVSFEDSEELAVFAAYETRIGVALYGETGQGIVYREHLNEVLALYASEPPVRLVSSDTGYGEIVNAIAAYTSYDEGYVVRYLAEDNKYAVAVLSPVDESSVLYGYVLAKNGSGYSIVYANFESDKKHYSAINSAVPYMNIDLIPQFSIYDNKLLTQNNFDFAPTDLKRTRTISDNDLPVKFVSGTKDYFYIVFKSGKKYIGVNGASGWDATSVEDWRAASRIMLEERNDAPTYILWQE